MDIGKKLKELRQQKELTLEDLASRSELTKGFLSQVERNLTAPSIATLEDILEEIVGDIRDEYDEDEEEELVDLGDGQYLVEGSMKLDDLNGILDLDLSSEDYDSVGGLVIDRLEHLPSQGEEVVCGNVRLVVEQVEKNRIDKVHLYVLPEEKEENIEGRRNSS